jgi:hypothetical protein
LKKQFAADQRTNATQSLGAARYPLSRKVLFSHMITTRYMPDKIQKYGNTGCSCRLTPLRGEIWFFLVSETVYAKISSDKEVERFGLYFPAAPGSGFSAAPETGAYPCRIPAYEEVS